MNTIKIIYSILIILTLFGKIYLIWKDRKPYTPWEVILDIILNVPIIYLLFN